MLKPEPRSVSAAAVEPARTRDGATVVRTGGGLVTVTIDASAWKMLMRGTVSPPPNRRVSVIGRPVARNADRTDATLAPGAACRTIAHAPATCGAAIDVPLSSPKPPPGSDDSIDSPGASSERNDDTFEKYEIWLVLSVAPTL